MYAFVVSKVYQGLYLDGSASWQNIMILNFFEDSSCVSIQKADLSFIV